MSFFDHDNIFFSFLGYAMSYLEFFGTVSGGIAVWLSSRGNIWSWPIGIINVVLFFFLFFQVQLYPDMFLQVFFFVTNLVGWWRWTHPRPGEENRKYQLKASYMNLRGTAALVVATTLVTLALGSFASRLHEWMPSLFKLPSAFPYADSFVLATSIVATYLMVEKKVECWAAWLITDIVATYLYYSKDILLVAILYFIFCLIALFGIWNWSREARQATVA